MPIISSVKYFLKSENGATAVEYGLIAAGIALAITLGVFGFGEEMAAMYDTLAALLTE
jgi:pilus assembly protein Flp/PilA